MRFDLSQYSTVEERLKRFWQEHPNGAVHTEMLAVTPDHKSVIIRASVHFDRADPMAAGVGIAQEAIGSGANQNCWVENADTSAVGRALANCGYSGDKRASREEMVKAGREPDALSATGPGGRFAQQRRSGSPPPAQGGEAGEIKPCYKCSAPVRFGPGEGGKMERYNADGGLHFKFCGKAPTGYEETPASLGAGMEGDPFADQ